MNTSPLICKDRASERCQAPSSIARRERQLLRSILWFPDVKWGPNVSTAIAFIPEFGESGLSKVAAAILEVAIVRKPTIGAVEDRLRESLSYLTDCPEPDPLPLSIQEVEALDMIAYYKGKSLWRLVAQAEQKMRGNFAGAVQAAKELKEVL